MVTNAGCTGILEKMLTSKGSGRQKAALAALGVKHPIDIGEKFMEKVLATLLGVLMGGLVTWFVAVQRMNYDRKKERRELVLTKYESLHEELENLKAYVGQYTSQLLSELATGEPIQPKELTVG